MRGDGEDAAVRSAAGGARVMRRCARARHAWTPRPAAAATRCLPVSTALISLVYFKFSPLLKFTPKINLLHLTYFFFIITLTKVVWKNRCLAIRPP